MGGETIYALGYQYVLTPVLLNALVMLFIALVFNNLFSWRKYPAHFAFYKDTTEEDRSSVASEHGAIEHADFVAALAKVDSFVDVSEQDLMQIYQLATDSAKHRHLEENQIVVGSYYTNGEYGRAWSVRLVVEVGKGGSEAAQPQVIYKVVAGLGRRSSGCVSLEEFATWAKYKVVLDEDNWKRETVE